MYCGNNSSGAVKKKGFLPAIAELGRLVAAVADGGHSTSLIEAIEQREQELQDLDDRLNAFRDA